MAKVSSEKLYSSFVRGLVTEANPLTYPENASLDEDNFVLERNGSRTRRLGVDYEYGYSLKATGLTEEQIAASKQSFHKWETPGGDTSISIGVIRINGYLWFIDLLTSSPSASFLNNGNPIQVVGLSNGNIETATILNALVLVGEDLASPVVLQYDRDTTEIIQYAIPVLIRDLFGVADGIQTDKRPDTLTSQHKYNLINQGWNDKIYAVSSPAPTVTTDLSSAFLTDFVPI